MSTPDRFVRQADLMPQARLEHLQITVIGLGAIGRPLTLKLAAAGARHLQLIDPDTVELHNVTTQGYEARDVGQSKPVSLLSPIRRMDKTIEVQIVRDVYRKHLSVGEVVFCAVDTISARSVIWKSLASKVRFWADGRMLGETLRVLAVGDEASRRHYPSTLFSQEEAEVGRCTARSTLYAASIAAGLMMHQFSRWLRGIPVEPDALLNLLASEMTLPGVTQ
ncbi:MAG TPA: ThiF family adenylyltransferase [Gemmatales bacterium]|nr:ThiF family adenylyltransferase [Gemmatales bacterium]